MIGSLLKECKIVVISPDASAAQTDVTATIDMSGFKSALCIAFLGDVTATSVLQLKALQGTASNGSGATAISGTGAAVTAGASDYDDKILALDVKNVIYRYLTFTLSRGTANAALNSIVAILYNGRDCPVTQGSDVMQGTLCQAA